MKTKNSQSVDPSAVNWEAISSKRLSDINFYGAMAYDLYKLHQKSGKPLKILSFPAPMWQWEIAMEDAIKSVKMKFCGLERDAKMYRKIERLSGALPQNYTMLPGPMSFKDYALNGRKKSYDVVYLDWGGTWSKEKKEDIDALLKGGVLDVGGTLILSLSLYGDGADELDDPSYDMPLAFYEARGEDKPTSNPIVGGIPGWIQNYAEEEYEVGIRTTMASVYYARTDLPDQIQPHLHLMFLRES